MKPIKYGKLTIIGDTMINLDEVRLVNDKVVLFKDDPVRYDVGQEAADAIRDCIKQIRQACGEPQPENPGLYHSQPTPPSKRAVCPSKTPVAFRAGKETPRRSARS